MKELERVALVALAASARPRAPTKSSSRCIADEQLRGAPARMAPPLPPPPSPLTTCRADNFASRADGSKFFIYANWKGEGATNKGAGADELVSAGRNVAPPGKSPLFSPCQTRAGAQAALDGDHVARAYGIALRIAYCVHCRDEDNNLDVRQMLQVAAAAAAMGAPK